MGMKPLSGMMFGRILGVLKMWWEIVGAFLWEYLRLQLLQMLWIITGEEDTD